MTCPLNSKATQLQMSFWLGEEHTAMTEPVGKKVIVKQSCNDHRASLASKFSCMRSGRRQGWVWVGSLLTSPTSLHSSGFSASSQHHLAQTVGVPPSEVLCHPSRRCSPIRWTNSSLQPAPGHADMAHLLCLLPTCSSIVSDNSTSSNLQVPGGHQVWWVDLFSVPLVIMNSPAVW